MAAGNDARNDLRCWRCSFLNRAGDQFCARCGTSFVQLDATTRYLCAAAHRDPAYCDAAIAEFLVEPTRAIPPAPGIDAVAVLRDAVAARARRRIRDVVLLLLLVVQAFVSLTGLVLWLVVAVIASVVTAGQAANRRPSADRLLSAVADEGMARGRRQLVSLLVVAGIVVVGILVLPQLLLRLGLYGVGPRGTGAGGLLPAVLLGLVALTVIAVDEFTVHNLVYTSFRPNRFSSDARRAGSAWERTVRTLGHAAFQIPLARVAAATERGGGNSKQADVVVHRGYSPFIGAGLPIHSQIIALPLEPAESDDDKKRTAPSGISVVLLQEHVAAAIDRLRSSSSLGPGRRLDGLTQHQQVMMAAERLVTHLDSQPQPAVLPDLRHAPVAHLPLAAARHLADTPQEWARYYRCFRIESWDRDLTTSCYLHAGTDQRMLFLEWTFCVLFPLREGYREIDRFRSPFWTPLGRSLMALVVLPATVVRRLRSVFRRFAPLKQRGGEVVPDKYGADKSLRELAADDDVQSYFQYVDVVRYVKILDTALFRAVGEYLEERGYSVVDFMRLADPQVNNMNFSGTFIGAAVGVGNTVQGNRTPSAAPKGRP